MNATRFPVALVVLAGLLSVPADARTLTFEDRVRAQEAIERVYYAHQIGATKTFEEAVPRAVLVKKVETYLKQSAALEKQWKTPVTGVMLERELARQAAGSRMTARLRELYASLGNDPFLIAECLARPALVDRLSRGFYAYDERIHGAQRREAEELRGDLERSGILALVGDPRRTEIRFAVSDGAGGPERDAHSVLVSGEEFARLRAGAPRRTGEIGQVVEGRDSLSIPVVLEEGSASLSLASFTVPKRTWDDWWTEASRRLDAGAVAAVDPSGVSLPTLPAAESDACLPDDTWGKSSLSPFPRGREKHTAVWTGTHMIVWGGSANMWPSEALDSGGRYDPATDTWTSVSVVGAPSTRYDHTAVWTGKEMIVWGGSITSDPFVVGRRYDPVTDEWRPVTNDQAPSTRYGHTAVWNGSRMIVWGGNDGSGSGDPGTGGRYDPETDTWTPTSLTGAPSVRLHHAAIWTGDRMIVWGGVDSGGIGNGGSYDPATDIWLPVSELRAPSPRFDHTAVWTGSEMIVWGGFDGVRPRRDGGRYDPVHDRWRRITLAGAPSGRYQHRAVWTGSRMVIWGASEDRSGGMYDPVANLWTSTSTVGAPRDRSGPAAVWTGSAMIVWGGDNGTDTRDEDTGGRYDPVSDTWTPTSTEGSVRWRFGHTAVWTGTHMVVWGGAREGFLLRDGGRYDPVIDTWTPTSLIKAGAPRQYHTAVWTGSEMIVWGGCYDGCYSSLDEGGRYDSVADTWTPTSPIGAPGNRARHVALWTGDRMLIWGAGGAGGSYDPVQNRWTPISDIGSPPQYSPEAVWTGTRMLAIGSDYSTTILKAGQYDPEMDTWTPTSTIDSPPPRTDFTAIWTGSEMIVWGGYRYPNYYDYGSRYNPAADTWTPISPTVGMPTPRASHTALWTGREMVVWGGRDIFPLDTGGRYDPAIDRWTTVTEQDAPAARTDHTTIWTGSEMIVWGGRDPNHYATVTDGGRYAVSDDTCEGE